jgi:hypothetical protein
MKWASEVLIRRFREKYRPIFNALGWETKIEERFIRHVGVIGIAIFRDGHVAIRHLAIHEVIARDTHWVRVASDYNGMGVVRTRLDEQVWKGFYSQLNRIVAACALDLIHEERIIRHVGGMERKLLLLSALPDFH